MELVDGVDMQPLPSPSVWLAACVLSSSACTGVVAATGGPSDDTEEEEAAADAAPPGELPSQMDAGSESTPPDATPMIQYPSGPYGTNEGDVITNLGWMGYGDTDVDSDDDPFNEAARMVKLEEFFAGNDPSATVIMIGSGAGWCGPCQDEALQLPGLYTQYRASGARFISTMFEDSYGSKADANYAKAWGQQFGLAFPTLADPDGLLDPYYNGSAIPMNMFIDATTMEIIDVHHGFSASYTRQILDAYTN